MNRYYSDLTDSYLFAEMGRRTRVVQENNPELNIIRLGIGDVTLPLPKTVVEAMKNAAEEQLHSETFRGYGPEQGYPFLREAVQKYYNGFGVEVLLDDIFIADGAKSDVANITDLFSKDNKVLIPNPVYPVYLDTNVMNGREIVYVEGKEENGFLPAPPDFDADIIYLCSPNNPTGATYNHEGLKDWVDYANAKGAIILYDAAYEAFIEDEELPRSIFEIEGADTCAIEFCSFSKTAGFTGTRCSYTVVPSTLERDGMNLRKMWLRRQTTKFNGVPYIIQRGAEAVFTNEGQEECRANIDYYKANAQIIKTTLEELGISSIGGVNSPYIWVKCQGNMDSWAFFDYLLEKAGVVITPGAGFGSGGEGYIRISSFGLRENVVEGMERIRKVITELSR